MTRIKSFLSARADVQALRITAENRRRFFNIRRDFRSMRDGFQIPSPLAGVYKDGLPPCVKRLDAFMTKTSAASFNRETCLRLIELLRSRDADIQSAAEGGGEPIRGQTPLFWVTGADDILARLQHFASDLYVRERVRDAVAARALV